MQLQKTAKALEELQPGRRSLPQRARSLLLMADRRPEAELHEIFGAEAQALIEQLIASGHLLRLAASAPAEAPRMAPAIAAVATEPTPAAAVAAAPGPLNLAGTRMYLFDLCERMFANRHEDKARVLREMLREARDLPALQACALAFLDAVQQHAGSERADALRERLRHLLEEAAASA